MGKYMPSIWLKMSNSKIPHFKFCRIFRESVTKAMGKTSIWTSFRFSPIPPLSNVEEQCYGFATLYSVREGILHALFKIHIIFCPWLSEIYKKNKEQVQWRKNCRNNGSKLLLSGTCQNSFITSTPWQTLQFH